MVVLHVVSHYPLNNIVFGESKTNVSTFDMLSFAHQLDR